MESAAAPAPPRPATYADLKALPEHVTAELIEGGIYVLPRPRLRHASTHACIVEDVHGGFGRRRSRFGPGGWIILGEPELHLGTPEADSLVLVPDIAGWRRERMPEVPDAAASGLAPDWVCEIVSPGRESHDRVRKLAWYGRVGVGWAWIVDADQRTVEVYERIGGRWVLHDGVADAGAARIAPFGEVEFDLSEWWAPAPSAIHVVSEAP